MNPAARQRFVALLQRDILEIDAAELDFGIYRVLNHRRAAVERFVADELPARIDAALTTLLGAAGEDEQSHFLKRQRRGKASRYRVPYDGSA